eukprot:581540-Prorocentrum_minimum.AAC.4
MPTAGAAKMFDSLEPNGLAQKLLDELAQDPGNAGAMLLEGMDPAKAAAMLHLQNKANKEKFFNDMESEPEAKLKEILAGPPVDDTILAEM